MTTTPTRADIFAAGRRSITIRPSRIRRATVDTPGSTIGMFVGAGATMAEEVAVFSAQGQAELRLATAARIGGAVLDRAVFDRFGSDIEPRRSANVSRAYVTFTRVTTGEGITVPAGFRVATEDGLVFATAVDAVFSPTSTGPVTVLAICQTAGTDGNVGVATIIRVVDESDEDTLAVTNGEVAAGGADAETDEQFYARAQRYWAGARRGTPAAVELGAQSVAGVDDAVITEVLDPNTFTPLFRARCVIAGVSGASNQALADLVTEELEEYRPLGVPVTVIPGQPLEISVTIVGAIFTAGQNTASLIGQMRQAIAAAINLTGPGKTLYRKTIWAAIDAFEGKVTVPADGLIEPAGDLAPPTVQTVIRTRVALIDIST